MRILLLLLLISGLAQGTVYRWVDANGVVHYSDTAPAKARADRLQPTADSQVRIRPMTLPAGSDPQAEDTAPHYQLTLLTPTADATLRDNRGRITVKAAVTPALARNHRLLLLLDGQAQAMNGKAMTLDNVDRGSHQLQLQAIDDQGQLLGSSDAITVHLHRQSVLQSQRKGT
ncbi:DUF4124 domain-containing protein [Ferrimonas sp. SCSIO 43195]|uniref:DUF4124 domain-containing protein n=1 Tax=Ferrimonas sp. SCSIO 43195 TaxID=2822844 RepID=UPI002074EA67|nr:DUF4124 domain-containing protein [Ferrimonas sp. SCSIO 43195]USD37685.1 DUF4124 domain-containing protein [Ferrimonas sp. SCSIO 43195]